MRFIGNLLRTLWRDIITKPQHRYCAHCGTNFR